MSFSNKVFLGVLQMNEFMRQIKDDLALIKRDYGYIDEKMQQDEYAFNYWILSRLYNIDEEIIPSFVTDINDKSIDCYVHYEDTKELFIIQNKFYDENTPLNRENVSDFLITPLKVLAKGEYRRSNELQRIFNRIHGDSEYKIWLHFYVTNNLIHNDINNLIENFTFSDERVQAYVGVKFYNLDGIKDIYFGDRFTNKVSFTAILPTRVSATSLDVRPKDYGMEWMIDLRYVMVNVAELYLMYTKALKCNYELFEENVREFLGTQGINNGIIKTLRSPRDRENFFYYNNGITIICEQCKTLRGNEASRDSNSKNQYGFELKNPQIVNGCQTINSIAEVLSHFSQEKIHNEFEKVFVLVKVFVFDEKTKKEKGNLDKNIVKYTNSQNGINDKAFASKHNFFKNIQDEFRNRGLLLLVKPSDKNKFTIEYQEKIKFAELRKKSNHLFEQFGLDNSKLSNFMIPLEKMLKVFLAFDKDGYAAFTKGSTVLKPNSPMYKDFSLRIETLFSIDNMLKIYLLYNKAEEDKKSTDNRTPIPYYLIGFIGHAFKSKDFTEVNTKLEKLFSDVNQMNEIYDFYKNLTPYYTDEYCRENNADYNIMIKQDIKLNILDRCINSAIRFNCPNSVKLFLEY